MTRSRLNTAFYVLLVFLSGAVLGIFGDRLYTARSVNAGAARPPKPADFRKKYVDELTSRLHLSSDQVTQLGGILDDTRRKYDEEHGRSKQQLAQIHGEQVQKIREILTASQTADYDKFRAEREKAREEREKRSSRPQ